MRVPVILTEPVLKIAKNFFKIKKINNLITICPLVYEQIRLYIILKGFKIR